MAELLTKKKKLCEAAITTDVASVDKGIKVLYGHTSDAFQNTPHLLDASNNAPNAFDGLDALKQTHLMR